MGVRREYHRYSQRVTRTKRWKVLRAEILERDRYRCQSCGCDGRLEVDHIKPVKTHPDLSYAPGNLQALCPSCHTRKTRIECGHPPPRADRKDWNMAVSALEKRRGLWSIPFDMRPSRIPVTIVSGPPGSGKSTYAKNHAQPGDHVIDFDDFMRSVGGQKWDTNSEIVQAAFKLRNQAIHDLATATRGRAWLIVTAPSAAERKEWCRQLLRAKSIVLDVDRETCKARINSDPDRKFAVKRMCTAVDEWWAMYAADGGSTNLKIGASNA